MGATWCINTEFNSVQITFDYVPGKSLRDEMKKLKFRWHNRDKYWYAKQTKERIALAEEICKPKIKLAVPETCETKPKTEEPKPKTAKANKFGVQVGDIFSCSWGYEQTNVDFFQVVKLCGEKSVRVRQVQPKLVSENAESGMSANRTYEITRDILPAVPSVFISDNENGDLKRLKSWSADGISNPIFEVGSGGYVCHLEPLGCNEHFESWWY